MPFWPEGMEIRGRTSTDGQPTEIYWRWCTHRVERVAYRWRVHTAWWTGNEIWRDYWEIATYTGFLCTIYHDMLTDVWYMERIAE